MSTTTDQSGSATATATRFRALASILHVLGLALALVALGLPARAIASAPEPEPEPEKAATPEPAAPADAPSGAEAPPSPATPTTVDAALEAGDLETAMRLATEARTKDPTPAAWRVEAQVAERRGDLAAAEAAYRGELEALPEGASKARTQAEKDLARVEAKARGTVAGEPESKHRAELDRKWSEEAEPKATAKKRRAVPPPSPRAPADRIVTKWYFWVTVGAIVASAAAVTAIAIRASRDDEPDALSLEPGPRSMGPTLLRF